MPFGFLRKNYRSLIWMVPAVALSMFVVEKVSREKHPRPPARPEMVKVPIEIIQTDQMAKIVYVELETQSIPEPSSLLFLPASLAALLRRRR